MGGICGPLFCTTEIFLTKISQVALMVKNLTANAGDVRGAGLIRDWEDPLEESMATHSSILTWRIPWAEQPSRLQPIGSQRIRLN